jgi:hypothetical protein
MAASLLWWSPDGQSVQYSAKVPCPFHPVLNRNVGGQFLHLEVQSGEFYEVKNINGNYLSNRHFAAIHSKDGGARWAVLHGRKQMVLTTMTKTKAQQAPYLRMRNCQTFELQEGLDVRKMQVQGCILTFFIPENWQIQVHGPPPMARHWRFASRVNIGYKLDGAANLNSTGI